METAFHEDEKSNTFKVKLAGSIFCRNYQRTKERPWLTILYMLNYAVIYSLSERESGSKHARHCVYISKIENSS